MHKSRGKLDSNYDFRNTKRVFFSLLHYLGRKKKVTNKVRLFLQSNYT